MAAGGHAEAGLERLGDREIRTAAAITERALEVSLRATERLTETRAELAKRLAGLGRESELERVEELIGELSDLRTELARDGAEVAQEVVALAIEIGRLDEYAYLAERLETLLPEGGMRGVVRGRREDVLAQLAIARQGLIGLQLVHDAGEEVIREIGHGVGAAVERFRRRALGS